jgi:peptidoglycan hydrolase-like amidase
LSRLHYGPAVVAVGFLWTIGCASGPPAKPGQKPVAAAAPSAPAAERRPRRGAPPPLPVPVVSAPSGVVYRVGLKSDLAELGYGTAGEPWILVSGGRAELVRGPVVFRAEAGPAVVGRFTVQAAAFSQEEPARRLLAQLSAEFGSAGSVAFSAERGVYRVLLGSFATREEADALAGRLRSGGREAVVADGAIRPAPAAGTGTVAVTAAEGGPRRLASPVEIFPPPTGPGVPANVVVDGKPYRGSLVVSTNLRGTLNLVNRVDLDQYLYGVVPAEMGPKRYDELEALKAQAVAARTYALAHRGQFELEGYDLCATPKCQVYAGLAAEDPLSSGAVDATRGLVLASGGVFADALFISTCGGKTENVENVFTGEAAPYLVSVDCGELPTMALAGARVKSAPASGRSGLEWRGAVLVAHSRGRRPGRAAWVETAQRWAGIERKAAPPSSLQPAAVYPSLLQAFDLAEARAIHALPREQRYYAEYPSATGRLTGAAREAYAFLLRFRFGAGEALPPPDRRLSDEEYAGLLFSGAVRLLGVSELSGKFLSREGANVWVRTAEGRVGLPVDPDLPFARKVGDRYFATSSLTLRPGDRLRWWKRGSQVIGMWVELDPAGPSFERESAWTEWVRRATGRDLARRMSARVAGTEVRDLAVTKRSPSGRVVEMRVVTDAAEITLRGFDVRQALELPELLFTFSRTRGPEGETEFVFLGRGWGHGVGLCQNGAYGMALGGATYDRILRHYYRGVEIVPAQGVKAAAPSLR